MAFQIEKPTPNSVQPTGENVRTAFPLLLLIFMPPAHASRLHRTSQFQYNHCCINIGVKWCRSAKSSSVLVLSVMEEDTSITNK